MVGCVPIGASSNLVGHPILMRKLTGVSTKGKMARRTTRKYTCSVPGHGSRCSAVWEAGGGKVLGRAREREEWERDYEEDMPS